MPLSTSIQAYADVAKVLKTALSAGGAKLTFPTPGRAIHWRMRAYMYRKLLQQELRIAQVRSRPVRTPYDEMVLRINEAETPNILEISFGRAEELFNITTPEGEALELIDDDDSLIDAEFEQEELDPETEAALAAARKRILNLKLD